MTALTASLPFDDRAGRKRYPPLGEVTRSHITTEEAAYYLNRAPQTLRIWACFQTGVVRPIRIGGRLAWPVAEIRRVLGLS